MFRRGFVLLAIGCSLGLLFATWLQPRSVQGDDAPPELMRDPAPPSARTRDFSRPFVEATRTVRPTVVQILNFQRDPRTGQLFRAGSGSGFLFSKQGHVLTNRHVIQGARSLAIKLMDGTTLTKVKVLGADPRSDVAVLQVTSEKVLPYADLGDSDRLEVGEWAIAIGAPFNFESSVSAGIISAVGRTGVLGSPRGGLTEYSEAFIQTDAALNPGNSGGPLINLDGQVIGINTAIETGRGQRGNVGIGFAIPINLARTIAISLIERGVAKRGWMGLEIGWVRGPELKAKFKVNLPGALIVTKVLPDSPAEAAGLRQGDILARVDGHSLKDAKILSARLAQAGPGGTIRLEYYRDGKTAAAKLLLAEERIDTFGLSVKDLDAVTARELGLRANSQGVVVTKVEEDANANRRGNGRVYPGDVIYRIDTRYGSFPVRSSADFERVMQLRPVGIKLTVMTKAGAREIFLRR